MIKALFFDIDGTLVSFRTHRIPKSTVQALTCAKDKGVEIYISTGRPYPLINNIHEIGHLIDGYITAKRFLLFLRQQNYFMQSDFAGRCTFGYPKSR